MCVKITTVQNKLEIKNTFLYKIESKSDPFDLCFVCVNNGSQKYRYKKKSRVAGACEHENNFVIIYDLLSSSLPRMFGIVFFL
jgi:hypothetical protein